MRGERCGNSGGWEVGSTADNPKSKEKTIVTGAVRLGGGEKPSDLGKKVSSRIGKLLGGEGEAATSPKKSRDTVHQIRRV